jgi:PAS domain S-box-containing protein
MLTSKFGTMTLKTPEAGAAPQLRESNGLYRLLFENGFDGLLLTAPDGSVLDANPAACRMLGRTREEIMAAGRSGVMDTSNPRLAEMVAERARTGKTYGELTARHKDGTIFSVEVSSVVFRDLEGELKTCTIMRDISERQAAEKERELLIQELQEALAKVRTLSGLLPICAACRMIRDKQGAWHPLEAYIRKHTEADFSHGICPDCRKRLYPEGL